MTKKNKNIYVEIILFLLPTILGVSFIFFYPILAVFFQSFKSSDGVLTLNNYLVIFKDYLFLKSIANNLKLILVVPVIVAASLFFAILLYERVKGWKFYRLTLFLPYMLAIPVIGILFSYLFSLNGVLNEFLKIMGLGFLTQDWLGSQKFALWTVMSAVIWRETGFGIMIIFSRMMSINKELYEAAELDGCNWLQKHIHITIPQTRHVLSFISILLVITALSKVFSYIFVMTAGNPAGSTYIMELYIYNNAFKYLNIGIGSASAVVLFLFTFIFVIFMRKALRETEDD